MLVIAVAGLSLLLQREYEQANRQLGTKLDELTRELKQHKELAKLQASLAKAVCWAARMRCLRAHLAQMGRPPSKAADRVAPAVPQEATTATATLEHEGTREKLMLLEARAVVLEQTLDAKTRELEEASAALVGARQKIESGEQDIGKRNEVIVRVRTGLGTGCCVGAGGATPCSKPRS